MHTAIWIIGAWLLIGIVVTWETWQREQDGWLWAVLLWPLQLASKIL